MISDKPQLFFAKVLSIVILYRIIIEDNIYQTFATTFFTYLTSGIVQILYERK